jgi:hypothetical protein
MTDEEGANSVSAKRGASKGESKSRSSSAQTNFIRGEHVPILSQPLNKTERHGCPKRF